MPQAQAHEGTSASTSHFINDTQRRKALKDAEQALDDADQLHSIYIVLANMAQRSQSNDALKVLIK